MTRATAEGTFAMTRPDWIKTVYEYPPIPYRSMDWVAYDDRLGADCSPYGYGETEAEAVRDLIKRLAEEDMS